MIIADKRLVQQSQLRKKSTALTVSRDKVERELFPVLQAHRPSCSQTSYLDGLPETLSNSNPELTAGSHPYFHRCCCYLPTSSCRNPQQPLTLLIPSSSYLGWSGLFSSVSTSAAAPEQATTPPHSSTAASQHTHLPFTYLIYSTHCDQSVFLKYTPNLKKCLISQDCGLSLSLLPKATRAP